MGTPHKFLYDFSGRLVSDSNVYASGDERAITLQGVSSSTGGRFVRRKSPLGRTMIRHIERGAALGDVTERISTTGEDGLITVSERKASGTSVVTTPDRTTVTTTVAADPRLGLSAPYASSVVTLNQIGDGGVDAAATVSLTETRVRAAGWVSPALTSTTSVTDTVTFNGSAGTDVAGGGAPDVKSLTQIEALTNIQTAPTLSVTRGTLKRATVFDGAGRVTAVQVPGLHDVVMAYDTEGRLSTVTQSGRSTTFAYDAVTGYPTTVTVNPGAIITNVTSRDGVGRPKSMTLPGSRVVDLGYNFAGRQFTVTPPGTKQSSAVAEQRPAHVFGVDAAGLLTAYTAPDIGATVPRVATHGWDKDKAPMGMFLPQPASLPARTTFVSYDEAGRVKGLGHSATGSVAARTAEITYDGMGRPSVLTSKVGGSVTSTATTTYTSGLVTQVSTAITGATTVPIAYQYDGFMRVKTRTIGGAVPIASTWDSATGLLTGTGGVGITRTGLVGGFQSGQLAGLTASGGRTYTVTYPATPSYGEPQKLEAKFGATSKYSVDLTRDGLGRVQTRHEVNETTTTDRYYEYDTAGRLWRVRNGLLVTSPIIATYTYDSNGNRTDQAYAYDLHDRQTGFGTGVTFTYDANGERKTRSTPAQTLTYDPQGQLVSVDAAGTVITYEVDGLGRRVKRTKNGVSERYLWDGSRIAAVLDNAGVVLRRFVYATSGHVPDAILEGSAGTLYLVVKDERGSVRQLIDPAGLVAEKYEYDEWGRSCRALRPSERASLASRAACTTPTRGSCASARETTTLRSGGGRRGSDSFRRRLEPLWVLGQRSHQLHRC
ncbi:MAG: RHS repeat protein [Myxococcales bacterium]|nr:RHS repeat protein [Myxococcales bacterium]